MTAGNESNGKGRRKPEWLKKKLPAAGEFAYLQSKLSKKGLHTICRSGLCPNIGECWSNKTATFMILGDICTRGCRFCGVNTGTPEKPDLKEPNKLATVVREIGLTHCVITSVTRDDLEDGGAAVWAETISQVKALNPDTTIEALIPDFRGNSVHANRVFETRPDILSHNLETVKRLAPGIRAGASYSTSLGILRQAQQAGLRVKSGIMLGLGESLDEVESCMDDLLEAGCTIFTAGQYLQPGKTNIETQKYYTPAEFESIKEMALVKGFEIAECAPLVRSSYHSHRHAGKQHCH